MPIQRNAAHDIPFVLINNSTGQGLTGASVTGYRVLDGGVQSAVSGSIVEKGGGQYLFEGAAEDFNAVLSSGLLFIAANAVPIHILVLTDYIKEDAAYDIPFLLIDRTNGNALIGANPSAVKILDGGIQSAVAGTFVERGNGQYVFQAALADFNADDVIGFLITATDAVPVHLTIDLKERFTVTESPSDSPASILAQYLIDILDAFSDPTDEESWPIYIAFMPDEGDIEFDCAAVYDTTPVVDSKNMRGTYIVNNGIQLRVRSSSYETAYVKISSVVAALALVHGEEIVMSGGSTYEIVNISVASNAVFIGNDEKNRNHFTANLLLKIKEV